MLIEIKDKVPIERKQRLDVFLVDKGVVETRSKAQQLIKEGHVKVNGKVCNKCGVSIKGEVFIEVDQGALPYVSRGGLKLDYALKNFKIDVSNKTCLDVGASTGGFTDCLLKHGAKLVYAVDVGYGQLHPHLRNEPRVVYFEKTDIRNFNLPEGKTVDLICIDVSFISLTLILPVIKKFLSSNGEVIVLIKPQFEVGPGKVNKEGLIKNKEIIYKALYKVLECAQKIGLFPVNILSSPIKGKKGNIEYLAYLRSKRPQKLPKLEHLISELKKKEGF